MSTSDVLWFDILKAASPASTVPMNSTHITKQERMILFTLGFKLYCVFLSLVHKKSCWDTRDRRASVIVLFFVIWLTANYLVISACCMVTTLLISFCDWLLLDGIKTNAYCFVSATKNSGQLVELWAWLRSTLIPLVTVLTFSLSRILTPCI